MSLVFKVKERYKTSSDQSATGNRNVTEGVRSFKSSPLQYDPMKEVYAHASEKLKKDIEHILRESFK